MRGGFLVFLDVNEPLILFCLLEFGLFPSIKLFLPSDYLIFLCFLIFLSLTCYDVWLFGSLFIGFYMGDSNYNTASIKHRSHIKSLFVIMLY